MDRYFADDRGMALILVLIFTTVLLLLGTALLNNALTESLISGYHKQELQQQYLAEAGLEFGIAVLQTDFYYNQILTGTLMDGSFRVTFENSGLESRRIRSTGIVEGYTFELQLEVNLNPDGSFYYGQWQRL